MSLSADLALLYRRDLTRLVQELSAFPDDDSLWRRLPGVTNSSGNLALHIEGNLRDFIGRQVGGVDYQRRRDTEFGDAGLTAADLIARVEPLIKLMPEILAGLTEADLERDYPQEVLGVPMTTRLFMIHLLLHLNYHMGQIDYLRRIASGGGPVPFAKLDARL